MNLCGWLRILSAEGTARERNEAAAHVRTQVAAWAGGYVRRHAPCSVDDDDVSETLQHLLMRCATGTSRFRGETEGEAHAFCMRVLSNKGRDLCRAKRRFRSLTQTNDDGDDADMELVGDTEVALDEMALRDIAEVFQLVEQAIVRLHRAKDAPGLVESLRCHVDARLGATLDDQLESHGYLEGEARDAATFVKARNRVYQYRNRGRKAGCAALTALVGEGRLGPDDIEHAVRILGCDVDHAGGEKEKGALS